MRRKTGIIYASLLFLFMAGCTNKAYEEAMQKGKAALDNGDYTAAELFFGRSVA